MEVYLPYETPTGPQLEVLGVVETKLPQPVQRRATAWVLTVALDGGEPEGFYSAEAVIESIAPSKFVFN